MVPGNGWHTSGVVSGLDVYGVCGILPEKEVEPGDLFWWLLLFGQLIPEETNQSYCEVRLTKALWYPMAWFGGLVPVRGQRKERLSVGRGKVPKCRHGCHTVLGGSFCLKSVTLGPGHKTQPRPHLGVCVCVWEGQRATCMWNTILARLLPELYGKPFLVQEALEKPRVEPFTFIVILFLLPSTGLVN